MLNFFQRIFAPEMDDSSSNSSTTAVTVTTVTSTCTSAGGQVVTTTTVSVRTDSGEVVHAWEQYEGKNEVRCLVRNGEMSCKKWLKSLFIPERCGWSQFQAKPKVP